MTAPYLRVLSTPALQATVDDYRRQTLGLSLCSMPSSTYLRVQISRGLEVIEDELARRRRVESGQ